MRINKTFSAILVLMLCAALLAGCGGGEKEPGTVDPDDLVSSTGGDLTPDPTPDDPDPVSYTDTVAEITAINPNEIDYKVYESADGGKISDYSSINAADYTPTDKTGTLSYDSETPFYISQNGSWYMADISTVPVGSMIVIARVEGTGELEGVIIFKVAE